MRIRRILVPVDFSPPSRRALDYAAEFGRFFGAEITLVFVVEPTPYAAPGEMYSPSSSLAVLFEQQRRRGREQLVKLRRELRGQGVAVRAVLETGVPHERIVARARRLPADLIIMATHGRTGLSHLLLGSVTEKVVRTARCPVLTVRGAASGGRPARRVSLQPRRRERSRRSGGGVRGAKIYRRPAT